MADDIITRDDNGDLAVNVVVSTEANVPYNYDDCFTLDTNNRRALRVVGAGGGDSHNKGYFATQAALEEAYPTGEAGDWAIVGATDTVWIWDTDNSEWVDSDQKGQVTSVNGQTGAVTVSEVPSQTGYSGRVLGTDGFVAGWVVPEKVQRSTMPQASEDELGNIYQFTGTTDANYTNGYFYKCVSDGQEPATYSWTQTNVQPAPSGLPDQTGQSGKFLTTDGTDASWGTINALQNTATGTNSLTVAGNTQTWNQTINIGGGTSVSGFNVSGTTTIGSQATGYGSSSTNVGAFSKTGSNQATAYGASSEANALASVALGCLAKATAQGAIQINASISSATNSDANTFKVANTNGNFEIMSADGTIPADRLTHAINKYSTMPTASASNEGWIVQFTGTTDSTYTHGHLYECVSDGADPATYSWTEVQLGGGGSSYTAGTGIDITSGVISVENPVYTNTGGSGLEGVTIGRTELQYGAGNGAIIIGGTTLSSSGRAINGSVVIGGQAQTQWGGCIAIGGEANADGDVSIAIGGGSCAATGAGAIQLGFNQTNADDNTFKVANLNGNYEIMSADGTIPTARLTKVNTTATLAVADWSSNTQTVTVSGVKADSVVFVSPAPTSASDYASAGILCTSQSADSLTFSCTQTPSTAIVVNIVCM